MLAIIAIITHIIGNIPIVYTINYIYNIYNIYHIYNIIYIYILHLLYHFPHPAARPLHRCCTLHRRRRGICGAGRRLREGEQATSGDKP